MSGKKLSFRHFRKSVPVFVVLMFLFSGFYIIANVSSQSNAGNPVAINTPYTSSSSYEVTFTETGLPLGTAWGIQVGSFYVSGNTSSLVIQLPDGTYTYYVFDSYVSDFLFTGSVSVSGSSVSQNFNFYKATFDESGLASGAEMKIVIQNSTGLSISECANSSQNFYLPNGNYSYSINVVDPAFSGDYQTESGYFVLNGSSTVKSFTFYQVQFSTSGLPAGADNYIYVYLQNTKTDIFAYSDTNGSILFFYVPSGNYSYEAYLDEQYFRGGSRLLSQGFVNTSISKVVPAFSFKDVAFTGSYIPSGSCWGFLIYDYPKEFEFIANSSTHVIDTYIPQGSYEMISYLFTPQDLSSPTYENTSTQYLNVSKNLSQTVSFNDVYNLTFKESGLPSGSNYYIDIMQFDITSTSTVSIFVQSGNYSYTAGDSTASFSDEYTVDVKNQSTVVSLNFYPLEFKVSGPPSYFGWTSYLYNLSNSVEIASHCTTFNNYTYYLLPGNYSYSFSASIIQPSSYPSNDLKNHTTPGKVYVTDKGITQYVSFSLEPGYYFFVLNLTFAGSQIPILNLYIHNQSSYYYFCYYFELYSRQNTLTFAVQNGSYAYRFQYCYPNCKFTSGDFNINGSSVQKTIDLNELENSLQVTFSESGLPAGDTWSVSVGNITHNSTMNFITFVYSYPNDREYYFYSNFEIKGAGGYLASPSSGIICLEYGQDTVVNVSFSNIQNKLGYVTSTVFGASNILINGVYYSDTSYSYGTSSMVMDENNNMVYLTYGNECVIYEFNTSSETLREAVQLSSGVRAIAYDSHNGMLYFSAGSIVGEISPSSNNIIVNQIQTKVCMSYLTYNPVTNSLYGYSGDNGNITVFNTTTLKIAASMNVVPLSFASYVRGMIYTPNTGNIVLDNLELKNLVVLNTKNYSITHVSLSIYPISTVYDASTNTIDVFGVNYFYGTYSPEMVSINSENYSLIKSEALPAIVDYSYYDPSNGNLYLSSYNETINGYGSLLVMDGSNYSILGTIIVIDNPGYTLYVPGVNVLVVSSETMITLSLVKLPSSSSINISFIIILGSIIAAIVVVGSLTGYFFSRRAKKPPAS